MSKSNLQIKPEKKKQLDLQEVAALIGKSWQSVRYHQTSRFPVPHYKRKKNHISGKFPDGHTWRIPVDPRLKGTRVIFFKDEVVIWSQMYNRKTEKS